MREKPDVAVFSGYKSMRVAAVAGLALLLGAGVCCRALAQRSASPTPSPVPRPPVPLALRSDSTPLYPQLKEAFLLIRAGKIDEAAASYRAVLEKAVATQDQPALALAHDGLGLVLYYKADYPAARAASEQAVALYRKLQDPVSEAQTNGRLGAIAYAIGDEPSAASTIARLYGVMTRWVYFPRKPLCSWILKERVSRRA